VQQDVVRRIILREHDVVDGINIDLISQTARFALNHGYDVILEGVLNAERYSDMLQALRDEHLGSTRFYYFDIPFAETLRRHATRPQAAEFGPEYMRGLYTQRDFLSFTEERVVEETSSLESTVARLVNEVFSDRTVVVD
jgi:hypothetical protein